MDQSRLIGAAFVSAFLLLGCQANSGPEGASSGGLTGTISPDTGFDEDGNTTGDGSNLDTAFPNDGSVGGTVTEDGIVIAGDGAEPAKGFICTNSLSFSGGVTIEASANGLVGSVLGPLLDLLSGDSVTDLLNSINDGPYSLDGDLTTAAKVTQTVSGLVVVLDTLDALYTLPEGSQIGSGNYAVALISFPPSLLDLGLLSFITLDTLKDGEVQETGATLDSTGLSLLGLSTDLIGGAYAMLGYKTKMPYDQVRMSIGSNFLSVDVGENVFIHEICTGGRLVDPPVEE